MVTASSQKPEVNLGALDELVRCYELESRGWKKDPLLRARQALSVGNIDGAIELLRKACPQVLSDLRLVFKLHSQRFVELIRAGDRTDGALGMGPLVHAPHPRISITAPILCALTNVKPLLLGSFLDCSVRARPAGPPGTGCTPGRLHRIQESDAPPALPALSPSNQWCQAEHTKGAGPSAEGGAR